MTSPLATGRPLILVLALVSALAGTPPMGTLAEAGDAPAAAVTLAYHPTTVLVAFAPGTSLAARSAAHAALGGRVLRSGQNYDEHIRQPPGAALGGAGASAEHSPGARPAAAG